MRGAQVRSTRREREARLVGVKQALANPFNSKMVTTSTGKVWLLKSRTPHITLYESDTAEHHKPIIIYRAQLLKLFNGYFDKGILVYIQ